MTPEPPARPTNPARGGTGALWLVWGALNAAAAVGMAAASNHASALQAASYLPHAVAMHQYHALAIVLVGVLLRQSGPPVRAYLAAGALFSAGLLLFSYQLYARALWDFSALRSLVPLGGMAFMAGWVALALGAYQGRLRK